jgi:aspartate aminotransferase
MPKISNKGLSMPESPIRKLVPYAEKAVAKGKRVYYLNIGQPDIETPVLALDSVKLIDLKVVEYTHSAGYEHYRKGLAKYYQDLGYNIDYTNVMVTTGGSEALQFGFMSCFDEGDELIIPEPFYANYNSFSKAAGVKVVPIVSNIQDGFSLPSIKEFEQKITSKTKGILICNPGNPTGYLYSREELLQIKEIVKKHDLFLFADEVYREFCYDNREHVSVLEFEDIAENVILIDSVSKRYSMCGARVGALVTKNKEVFSTALKFAQARLSPPTFGQLAGLGALNTPQSYFDEVKKEYVARRDILIDGLRKIPGVICPNPGGAFYVMVEFPVDDAEKFCQWLLEDFEYEGQTVMMAPGNGFYSNPELGKKQARIAYVLVQESLVSAVKCLEVALQQYPGKDLK